MSFYMSNQAFLIQFFDLIKTVLGPLDWGIYWYSNSLDLHVYLSN